MINSRHLNNYLKYNWRGYFNSTTSSLVAAGSLTWQFQIFETELTERWADEDDVQECKKCKKACLIPLNVSPTIVNRVT